MESSKAAFCAFVCILLANLLHRAVMVENKSGYIFMSTRLDLLTRTPNRLSSVSFASKETL